MAMSVYNRTEKKILEHGIDLKNLKALVSNLTNCSNATEAQLLLRDFKTVADDLPWPQDHDFGALILQNNYDKAQNKDISRLMLVAACERARWCATCATSGGEGLARSEHLKELEHELTLYT